MYLQGENELTHWGRVTHICVGKQNSIGSDNGLSPGRHQAIIWTKARILLIGPLGTNFSEISIKILTFSFTKMRLKVSSAKWCPFCLGLNVLTYTGNTVNNPLIYIIYFVRCRQNSTVLTNELYIFCTKLFNHFSSKSVNVPPFLKLSSLYDKGRELRVVSNWPCKKNQIYPNMSAPCGANLISVCPTPTMFT